MPFGATIFHFIQSIIFYQYISFFFISTNLFTLTKLDDFTQYWKVNFRFSFYTNFLLKFSSRGIFVAGGLYNQRLVNGLFHSRLGYVRFISSQVMSNEPKKET